MSELIEAQLHYDFSSQIQQALEMAPFVAELDDKFVEEELPGDILISEGHAYIALLKQTFEIVYPNLDEQTINRHVRVELDHEMGHAAAAGLLGKSVQYRVRILKDGNPENPSKLLAFSVRVLEPLTNEESSFIAAAPDWLSEQDEERLRVLGASTLRTSDQG
jgi:hypothetical protein